MADTPDLFTVDHARTHLVTDADPTGLLGALELPTQACRAVFLAAEVGAVSWDESRWPGIEFGVWCEEPAPEQPGRRRRRAEETQVSELSTWLQLDPGWPQLGGRSVAWPPRNWPADRDQRIAVIVASAVEALNSTHRRAVRMARALLDPPLLAPAQPAPTQTSPAAPSANGRHSPAPTPDHTAPDHYAAPDLYPASQSSWGASDIGTVITPALAPATTTRSFTAASVAGDEHDVASVLARLVSDAEAHLSDIGDRALLIGHAITPLPAAHAANGNGFHATPYNLNGHAPLATRYLVTVTATAHHS
jgi:hypothetical protein